MLTKKTHANEKRRCTNQSLPRKHSERRCSRYWVGKKKEEISWVPDKECVVSAAYGLAGEEELQLDRVNGPVTSTEPSGWSSAAFRGLMELKWTSDRQPVKPSEPNPAKSASSAPGSEKRWQTGGTAGCAKDKFAIKDASWWEYGHMTGGIVSVLIILISLWHEEEAAENKFSTTQFRGW